MTNKSTTAGIIEIPKRKTTMVKTEKRKLPLKSNSKRSDSLNSKNSILSTPSGITETVSTTANNQSKPRTITTNDSSSESSDNTLVTSPTQPTSSSLQPNNTHLTEEEIKLKQLEQAKKILLRQQEAPNFRHELKLKEKKEPTRGRSLQSLKRDQLRSPSPSPRYTSSSTTPPLLLKRRQQSDTNYYHAESDDSNTSNNSSITNKKTATKKRNNIPNASKPVCTCLKPDSIWCQMCESKRFQQRFSNWTSGNKHIDNFIQETQKNSMGPLNYVEWIQHNRFRNIQKIDEGGYGIVYSATWLDGPRWIQDHKDPKKWTRENNKKVSLKFLNNSENITSEHLKEISAYFQNVVWDNSVVHCYGISQDPSSKNYIIVLEYAESDLYQYINSNPDMLWSLKLALLCDISRGLNTIHKCDLVHGNFHGGNILIIKEGYVVISDMGFNHKSDEKLTENQLFGVLPFFSPEIIRTKKFLKESDIYSFGIIMWELASEDRIYNDRVHDIELAIEVCDGLKPKRIDGVPQCWVNLMEQCLDVDATKRPDILTIHRILVDWLRKIIDTPKLPYRVNTDFSLAENYRLRKLNINKTNAKTFQSTSSSLTSIKNNKNINNNKNNNSSNDEEKHDDKKDKDESNVQENINEDEKEKNEKDQESGNNPLVEGEQIKNNYEKDVMLEERKEEEQEKIKVGELLSKSMYHSQLYDFGNEQFLDFMTNLTESEVGSTDEPPQSPSNESTSSSKVTCGELENMSITTTTDDI